MWPFLIPACRFCRGTAALHGFALHPSSDLAPLGSLAKKGRRAEGRMREEQTGDNQRAEQQEREGKGKASPLMPPSPPIGHRVGTGTCGSWCLLTFPMYDLIHSLIFPRVSLSHLSSPLLINEVPPSFYYLFIFPRGNKQGLVLTRLLVQLSEPGACHWPWQWKQTNGPREKDSVCEDTGIQDTDWGGGLQERGNPRS